MTASRLDTNLEHKKATISVTAKNILEQGNIAFKYYKFAACDCGGDDECKFCEGKRIREEEVSITIPFTSYIQGAQITVSRGGDIDRYGRIGDLIVDIDYSLHTNMRLNGGRIEYRVSISDVAFGEMLSSDEKRLNVLVPS